MASTNNMQSHFVRPRCSDYGGARALYYKENISGVGVRVSVRVVQLCRDQAHISNHRGFFVAPLKNRQNDIFWRRLFAARKFYGVLGETKCITHNTNSLTQLYWCGGHSTRWWMLAPRRLCTIFNRTPPFLYREALRDCHVVRWYDIQPTHPILFTVNRASIYATSSMNRTKGNVLISMVRYGFEQAVRRLVQMKCCFRLLEEKGRYKEGAAWPVTALPLKFSQNLTEYFGLTTYYLIQYPILPLYPQLNINNWTYSF